MSQPGETQEAAPGRSLPIVAVVGVAVAVAVLGVPFGLLWAVVAPEVPLQMTSNGPAYAQAQPEQVVAADGWYAILAVPFGIVLAVTAWLAGRRIRGVPGLATLIVGAIGAGLLAWWVGRNIGLGSYRETLAAAENGVYLHRPPDLSVADVGWWPPHVFGVLLIPALAAAITYTLLAAWSAYPSLRPDEPPENPTSDDLGVA